MAPLKNIVWVGAGRLSLPLLKRVAATEKFTIKLLVRNLSTYSSLPSGLASAHQVDYSDHKALVNHLRGQDIVIVFTSLVPGNGHDIKHIALINAAIDAGVQYFIPSEWALDSAGVMGSTNERYGPTLPTDMVLAPKRTSHNYLLSRAAEGKIKFAAVYPGVMFEISFQNGSFRFDVATRAACLADDGVNPFPATTLGTLSRVIMSLFTNPALISNRFYHVIDGVLTQQEVFRALEKESRVPWTRTSYSTKEEYADSLMTPFFGGLQVFSKIDNELLGVGFGEVELRNEVERVVRALL
ncbi:NmrA-like protein [Macrophomina phaseolina MS6]|uniref:NmrA-like protein n=1 Tax=Macrophomina phaseolina (strain MS6) TaxID=1126212 RepID=K2RE89_MACPH|nr:NmrA-like protein [Macrophomina phaseolina MS6]